MHKHQTPCHRGMRWTSPLMAEGRLCREKLDVLPEPYEAELNKSIEGEQQAANLSDEQTMALQRFHRAKIRQALEAAGSPEASKGGDGASESSHLKFPPYPKLNADPVEPPPEEDNAVEATVIGASANAILPTVAASVPVALAASNLPILQQAGLLTAFGAPTALGAALGYAWGKKVGHPVLGTAAGTVTGAIGSSALIQSTPYLAKAIPFLPQLHPFALPILGAWLGSKLDSKNTLRGGMIGAGISSVPLVQLGIKAAGLAGWWPHLAALSPVLAGAMLGNILSSDSKIGKSINIAAGAGIGAAAYFGQAAIPAALGSYLSPLLLSASIGASIGHYFGSRKGAWIGGILGTATGGGLLATILAGAPIAGAAIPTWPLLATTISGGAAGLGLYGLGRLHRWAWGTPHNVGTWGIIGRGLISPVSLPMRFTNWLYEKAWDVPKTNETLTRAYRATLLPAIPGLLWHRLGIGAGVKGFFNGFGANYESGSKGRWFLPRALEWATSRPGQMIRGAASLAGSAARTPSRLWHYFFDKNS